MPAGSALFHHPNCAVFSNSDPLETTNLKEGASHDQMRLILAIGKAMELELDNMIKKELAVLEERRFHDAQELVKEIETVPPEVTIKIKKVFFKFIFFFLFLKKYFLFIILFSPEVMEDVIKIMQANKEELQVEADGTVEVSYNDLSAKTISDIRKLLHSKNLLSSQQNGFKSDVKQENMKMDVS